jgi:hypothetical protein
LTEITLVHSRAATVLAGSESRTAGEVLGKGSKSSKRPTLSTNQMAVYESDKPTQTALTARELSLNKPSIDEIGPEAALMAESA